MSQSPLHILRDVAAERGAKPLSRNVTLVSARLELCRAVAEELGVRLGRRVLDLHAEVERWQQTSWSSLVALRGERVARQLLDEIRTELGAHGDLILTWHAARDEAALPPVAGDVMVVITDPAGQASPAQRADGPVVGQAPFTVDGSVATGSAVEKVLAWVASQGDVLTPSEYEQVVS